MTSRERVRATLNHEQPDKVAMDFGGTVVTGMHASTMTKFREALKLENRMVKICEPSQLLGQVDEDLRQAVGGDVIGIYPRKTCYGFENKNWKEWQLQDGTKVLISGDMLLKEMENGDYVLFPQSNPNVQPSARLPKGGYYFDAIIRQGEIDEENEDGRSDFLNDFTLFTEEDLKYLEITANDYYKNTEYSIVGGYGGAGFGDVSIIPGTGCLETPGVRNLEDWFMWHILNPNYVKEVFEYQKEICLKNLELYYQAVGNKIDVIYLSATDFGSQHGELISKDLFREFYKKNIKDVNDWIHKHTKWKTFFHTCGSVVNLLDEFVEIGVDILNPVQLSADKMDGKMLKEKYGDKFTFWGAGTDTQKTLPFGNAEEVKIQTKERLDLFGKNGGYVCAPIHNIQPNTPVENVKAYFDTIRKYR